MPAKSMTYHLAKEIVESMKCKCCEGDGWVWQDYFTAETKKVDCIYCNGTGLIKNPLKEEYTNQS